MGLTRVLHDVSAYRAADTGEDGNPKLSSAVIVAASKPLSLDVESGPATLAAPAASCLLSVRIVPPRTFAEQMPLSRRL